MILLSTTHQPARDLGYLLHKHPDRVHVKPMAFGQALVAFPEASDDKATAVLNVDVDPIKLVRGSGQEGLSQYVNDRPYAAGSHLSAGLAEMFGTAMGGKCRDKPELAEKELPFQVRILVLPSREGEARIRSLFEPLGLEVEASRIPLDPRFPQWGSSRYFDVSLKGNLLLRDLLRALYLLIPALDSRKHYFAGEGEVQKMLEKGQGWLAAHPQKQWIASAYLERRRTLVEMALSRLSPDEPEDPEVEAPPPSEPDPKPLRLHEQRRQRLMEIIADHRPASILDLGCGDGSFLKRLIPLAGVRRLAGMDVSLAALQRAARRLRLEEPQERVQLLHGSLTYRDKRLEGFDLCTVVEVIEHLEPERLPAFEQTLFAQARPKVILLTTPNKEHNEVYGLEGMRHPDHRFEWTRKEFASWAHRTALRHGYEARIEGVGPEVEPYGAPSLLAEFRR